MVKPMECPRSVMQMGSGSVKQMVFLPKETH
jgi:hypothetical protein